MAEEEESAAPAEKAIRIQRVFINLVDSYSSRNIGKVSGGGSKPNPSPQLPQSRLHAVAGATVKPKSGQAFSSSPLPSLSLPPSRPSQRWVPELPCPLPHLLQGPLLAPGTFPSPAPTLHLATSSGLKAQPSPSAQTEAGRASTDNAPSTTWAPKNLSLTHTISDGCLY